MSVSTEDESDNIDGEGIAFIGGFPDTINGLYSAIQKRGGGSIRKAELVQHVLYSARTLLLMHSMVHLKMLIL